MRQGGAEVLTGVTLVALAPEPAVEPERALRYAGHIAAFLNDDTGLPEGLRLPRGAPRETAAHVLSFTRAWCLERNATFFAVVREGTAIGSITLSHVNQAEGTARTGYWLGSAHQGQGHGTDAFRQLVRLAQERGVSRLTARIAGENAASRRIWAKLGVPLEVGEDAISAVLADSGGATSRPSTAPAFPPPGARAVRCRAG